MTDGTSTSSSGGPHSEELSSEGAFVRQQSRFRGWVSGNPDAQFPPQAGRYHLYVSLACPWASRAVIVRRLKGLEAAIGMTVVDPIRDQRGWRFTAGEPDPLNGYHFLSEAYLACDPGFDQRVTVPVLWDTQTATIVNNESAEVMRMLETEFDEIADEPDLELYPEALSDEINALNDWIYKSINNGVYRAGFARNQVVYDDAVAELFAALDRCEAILSKQRFLCGPNPTEADWRLFVTLVRFDAVYVGHFKCNLRRIADYENLAGYLRDCYQWPGIAETVDIDQIKRHYYCTHPQINPSEIVPLGPLLDLGSPPRREQLGPV